MSPADIIAFLRKTEHFCFVRSINHTPTSLHVSFPLLQTLLFFTDSVQILLERGERWGFFQWFPQNLVLLGGSILFLNFAKGGFDHFAKQHAKAQFCSQHTFVVSCIFSPMVSYPRNTFYSGAGGAVLAGLYERVIWGKPPSIPFPEFLSRTFFFAADRMRPRSYTHWLGAGNSATNEFSLYYDVMIEPGKGPLPNGGWDEVRNARQQKVRGKPRFKHITPIKLSVLVTTNTINTHSAHI